jgi:hypothetical protein
MSEEAIRFSSQVFKVQTLIDGGLRLTLDIGQIDPAVIVALFDAKQPGVILEVAAVAVLIEENHKNDPRKPKF